MGEATVNHGVGFAPRRELHPTSSSTHLDTAPMDDIHAPTVSSGPTSSAYSNGIPKEQLSLQELISEKDRVEAELKALGHVLDSVRVYTASSHGRQLTVWL